MSTEQQIASVVIGWVFIAMAAAVVWFVRWTDRQSEQHQVNDSH